MATLPNSSESFHDWSTKAKEMAAEAKVLSGNKLEQLVVRIQRHTGRPKETCWRFVIQYGIKDKPEYRRWTDPEFDLVREELVKGTMEQVAKKLNRTPKAIRNMAPEEPPEPAGHSVRSLLGRKPCYRSSCSQERDCPLDRTRVAGGDRR